MFKSILSLTLAVGLTGTGVAAAMGSDATPLADEGAVSTPYYPASCLTYPLPDGPGDYPHERKPAKLLAQGQSMPTHYEDGHIVIWRQPCNPAFVDGQWQPRSALLLRVERSDEAAEKSVAASPVVRRKAGGALVYLRLPAEPNTLFGDMSGTTLSSDHSYVIEEMRQPSSPTDMNGALELVVSDIYGSNVVEFDVATFQPTAGDYPELFEPMPITGLLNGIFMDPAHSGEGLNIQVLRVGDTRIVDVAWFTYSDDGQPFWIGGSQAIEGGDNSVEVGLFHTAGGGFAGDFGNDVQRTPWGTLTLEFDNCNQVSFDYQSNAGMPGHVPSGSGSRTWQRLTHIDGLHCS